MSSQVIAKNGPSQAGKPPKNNFKLKYAPHIGMFKNSAGDDPIDQLKFMADMGFTAMEDNGMMGRTPEMQKKMGDEMARLGMTMGVFVVDKGGNGQNTLAAGKSEFVDIFLKGCRGAVETAKRVNAKWATVVPGDFARNLPIGIQTGNVIDALRRGAEILEPAGLVMVLEALSDTPNLFLRTSDQSYEVCRGVNSPSCKILYDIYHMQKNEGQIIPHISTGHGMRLPTSRLVIIRVGMNQQPEKSTTKTFSSTFIRKPRLINASLSLVWNTVTQ